MTATLPLVPAEVDLRDFSWMPIEIHRLRRSKAWLMCKRKPELAFYMLNLWTASWHDTPAGSIEDDDDVLADLAMCDPSKWTKVREQVLRGWIKASDGRLYHPVVADLAKGAWAQKQAQRHRTEAARMAREQKRQQQQSQQPRAATTENVTTSVTDSVTEVATGSNRTDRTGEGPERTGDSISVPVGTGSAGAPPDPVDVIFGLGVPLLTAAGVSDRNARSMLGMQRKLHGDAAVIEALQRCAAEKPLQPVPWLQAALKPKAGIAVPRRRGSLLSDEERAEINAQSTADAARLLFGDQHPTEVIDA